MMELGSSCVVGGRLQVRWPGWVFGGDVAGRHDNLHESRNLGRGVQCTGWEADVPARKANGARPAAQARLQLGTSMTPTHPLLT